MSNCLSERTELTLDGGTVHISLDVTMDAGELGCLDRDGRSVMLATTNLWRRVSKYSRSMVTVWPLENDMLPEKNRPKSHKLWAEQEGFFFPRTRLGMIPQPSERCTQVADSCSWSHLLFPHTFTSHYRRGALSSLSAERTDKGQTVLSEVVAS